MKRNNNYWYDFDAQTPISLQGSDSSKLTKNCLLLLPRDRCLFNFLELPHVSPRNLQRIINHQVHNLIPEHPENYKYGFLPLSRCAPRGRQWVFLFVYQRDLLRGVSSQQRCYVPFHFVINHWFKKCGMSSQAYVLVHKKYVEYIEFDDKKFNKSRVYKRTSKAFEIDFWKKLLAVDRPILVFHEEKNDIQRVEELINLHPEYKVGITSFQDLLRYGPIKQWPLFMETQAHFKVRLVRRGLLVMFSLILIVLGVFQSNQELDKYKLELRNELNERKEDIFQYNEMRKTYNEMISQYQNLQKNPIDLPYALLQHIHKLAGDKVELSTYTYKGGSLALQGECTNALEFFRSLEASEELVDVRLIRTITLETGDEQFYITGKTNDR